MSRDILYDWCREITGMVHFRPDRAKISEELYSHLLDSRDDLAAMEGISAAEAQTRVIAAMGDPKEIGRELNRAHSPMLGWLWLISKWLSVGLAVVLLGVLLLSDTVEDMAFWAKMQRDPYLFSESIRHEEERISLEKGDPWRLKARVAPRTVEYGDYKISVLEGRLYELYDTDVEPGAEPYYYYDLTVLLRVENKKPWSRFPEGLHFLYAEDSAGNVFLDNVDYIALPEYPTGAEWGDLAGWTSSDIERSMPNWTKGLSILAAPPEGLWEPEWVELKLPQELGDFVFRLDLLSAEVVK